MNPYPPHIEELIIKKCDELGLQPDEHDMHLHQMRQLMVNTAYIIESLTLRVRQACDQKDDIRALAWTKQLYSFFRVSDEEMFELVVMCCKIMGEMRGDPGGMVTAFELMGLGRQIEADEIPRINREATLAMEATMDPRMVELVHYIAEIT